MTSIIMPREILPGDNNEVPSMETRHGLGPLARWLMMGAMGLMFTGCGSPPAVSPLLQVAGKAITQESPNRKPMLCATISFNGKGRRLCNRRLQMT
ncbi:MAG: hypothetical protein HC898_10910 [Phycisphaerales bacterium]|nr:hypothetical protein [Phycisphaerales bacterium]